MASCSTRWITSSIEITSSKIPSSLITAKALKPFLFIMFAHSCFSTFSLTEITFVFITVDIFSERSANINSGISTVPINLPFESTTNKFCNLLVLVFAFLKTETV